MERHTFIKGSNISDIIREIDDIIKLGKSEKDNNIILSWDYAKALDYYYDYLTILHYLNWSNIEGPEMFWSG